MNKTLLYVLLGLGAWWLFFKKSGSGSNSLAGEAATGGSGMTL